MSDELVQSISNEAKSKFEDSQMSKAARLAMELNEEKRRLHKEMQDLQVEVESYKPSTPEGTIDSYIKWLATIAAVLGIFLQQAEFMTVGQVFYCLSAVAWIYVGHCWNDKAIIIGSAISGTAVCLSLVKLIA